MDHLLLFIKYKWIIYLCTLCFFFNKHQTQIDYSVLNLTKYKYLYFEFLFKNDQP